MSRSRLLACHGLGLRPITVAVSDLSRSRPTTFTTSASNRSWSRPSTFHGLGLRPNSISAFDLSRSLPIPKTAWFRLGSVSTDSQVEMVSLLWVGLCRVQSRYVLLSLRSVSADSKDDTISLLGSASADSIVDLFRSFGVGLSRFQSRSGFAPLSWPLPTPKSKCFRSRLQSRPPTFRSMPLLVRS